MKRQYGPSPKPGHYRVFRVAVGDTLEAMAAEVRYFERQGYQKGDTYIFHTDGFPKHMQQMWRWESEEVTDEQA